MQLSLRTMSDGQIDMHQIQPSCGCVMQNRPFTAIADGCAKQALTRDRTLDLPHVKQAPDARPRRPGVPWT